jgi:hypothetical protein
LRGADQRLRDFFNSALAVLSFTNRLEYPAATRGRQVRRTTVRLRIRVMTDAPFREPSPSRG